MTREAELLSLIQTQKELIESLQKENELLRQKVDVLIRQAFGSKSEKLNLLQDEMPLGITPEVMVSISIIPDPKKKVPSSKIRRQRVPEDLPIEVEILEPESVLSNPQNYRLIGEEVSEQYVLPLSLTL